jgi:transposase
MEDECHLLWGDTLGYVWGKRNEKIDIPILNERERQTYYGAINCFTGDFYISPYDAGNGLNTVDYVKYLQKELNNKKLLIIWDGASYHKFSEMREYLQQINKDLPPEEWQITCELFAPNAPEQNPVEDIWLLGKNFLRKYFTENKTFAQVKRAFSSFLHKRNFDFQKIQMYRDFII